jgi:hypothetical protein
MMRWLWSLVAGDDAPAGVTYRGEPAEEGAHVPYDLEPVSSAPKPPAVPAVALWETFQFNIVDAEDAFVGKVIRVVGTVERVEKRGEDYVLALARLRGTQRIVEVTFRKEDREELVGLRPGDSVVVAGRVELAIAGRERVALRAATT